VTDFPAASGPRQARAVDKRDRIVAAARRTFHEQGIERTTLADVAAAAGVPVGNLYYYFKTKDDLIGAVLDAYNGDYAMIDKLLAGHAMPQDRLKALVGLLTSAKDRIALYGCPIGTLCSELDKRDDDVRARAATVLGRLISTAEQEFRHMDRPDAHELAIALIAAYEGAALLANTLRDPQILTAEAHRLERWIDTLAAAGQPHP